MNALVFEHFSTHGAIDSIEWAPSVGLLSHIYQLSTCTLEITAWSAKAKEKAILFFFLGNAARFSDVTA